MFLAVSLLDLASWYQPILPVTSPDFGNMPRLRDEPESAPEYYEYMGRAMCIWARFEASFTQDLWFLASFPEVMPLFEVFPRSWSFKLKTYSKCFSRLPELKSLRDHADIFITEARKAARDRHIVAHGSFWGFTQTTPISATFAMFEIDPDTRNFLIKRYNCTIDEMRNIVVQTDDLNTRYVVLSFAVMKICNEIRERTPRSPKE